MKLDEAIKKSEDELKEIEALKAEEAVLKGELLCIDKEIKDHTIKYYQLQFTRTNLKGKLDRISNRTFDLTGIYNHLK